MAEEQQTFTDSQGAVREYPGVLDEDEQARYWQWWEEQVAANAHNHERPIAATSDRDYEALARARGTLEEERGG